MYSINVVYHDDVGIFSVSRREDGIHESVRGIKIFHDMYYAQRYFEIRVRMLTASNKNKEI
jgi:hypothetical protein